MEIMRQYKSYYMTPLGEVLLAASETSITGLWFVGQKHFDELTVNQYEEKEIPILIRAKKWLEMYFAGNEPDIELPIHFNGTEFQNEVWEILCAIPYGKTMTYGEIAKIIAERRGIKQMSAQAVGGAVGRNPISIIVPCHRVVGTDGKMTGYAGGINRKTALLKLEKE